MSALPLCTFTGGPWYDGNGVINTRAIFRVQTMEDSVDGTPIPYSDLRCYPDPTTGIVTFDREQGATILVEAPMLFAGEVSLVVPEDDSYDLQQIIDLDGATPPENSGFRIIATGLNFRASTFNITGTGVSVSKSGSQANLTFTVGGGIGFSGSLSSGGMMFGDGGTLARQSAKLTLDANGRLSHSNYVASYDQSSNTYSYLSEYALGTQAIASGGNVRQLDMIHLTGTMSGGTTLSGVGSADLFGINFNLTNSTPAGTSTAGGSDPSRVRAIIGTVTTTSSGSVRGIHLNAVGAALSTGPICGMALTCTPSATQGLSSCLQLDSGGSNGIAFGIIFSQSGGSYNYGIDLNNAGFNTPVYAGAPIRIPAQTFIVSRNNAGSADISLIGLDSADEIFLGNNAQINTSNPYLRLGPSDTGMVLQYVHTSGTRRFRINPNDVGEIFNVYPAPTSGNVGMQVWFNNGSAFVLKQVTTGAADSGGSGFRQLLISN